MPRYEQLLAFLGAQEQQELTLSLPEIERLVGESLPFSAWHYPAFWYTGNHLGRLLRTIGWKASPQINGEQVIFLVVDRVRNSSRSG